MDRDHVKSVKSLVKEFSDIFLLGGEQLTTCNTDPAYLEVKTDKIICLKPYPIPDEVKTLFNQELDELL